MSWLTGVHQLISQGTYTATATNVSGSITVGGFLEGTLHVVVTGKAGTTSKLRPVWQVSDDRLGWADHSAMATVANGTGVKPLPLTTLGRYGRLDFTVSGTGATVNFRAVFVGKE